MEQVSQAFRENCYDPTKRQRILFLSDSLSLSNEDISANGKAKFNIASCTATDQITFGCMPSNSVNVSVLNEDGRIKQDVIAGHEFACHIGVEVGNDEYLAPSNAISAVCTPNESVSVHSVAPYIRGNVRLASVLPQLMLGYKCKIMLNYNILYFVVQNEGERYYAKHEKTGLFSYGEYETPSDTEIAMLDRIMDDECPFDGIAYYDGGMTEFTYYNESVIPGEWATASGSVVRVEDALAYPIKSWNVGLGMTPTASGDDSEPSSYTTWSGMLSKTWGTAKSSTWGEYSGYSIYNTVHYESVPYGVWMFDRPRRVNTAVLTLSGKDRMGMFEEDSINFVNAISNRMLTPRELITAIAEYQGVPVGSLDGLNELADEITIPSKVYYQGKSLKDILSYAFEVGGANGIIDRRGRLSASNADNEPVELPYVYTFDVADYTAHTIGRMLIYRQGEYVQYETDDTVIDGVAYDWNENPFFNNMVLSGSWFSNEINKKYGGFRNAVTVSDADYSLWSDDVYSWTDDDGTYREPIFTMSVEWNGGGRVTYTNYGDETRKLSSYTSRIEGVTSVNDKNLQGFNKAQYNNRLYFDEEGLTIQSKGMRILNQSDETVLSADDEGNLTIKGTIGATDGYIGEWAIVEDGIKCGGETDFVFLGYDPDGNIPAFISRYGWGVTPEGVNICETTIEGAHIHFANYLGDQAIVFQSIGLDDESGDIVTSTPIVMGGNQLTTQSANTALVALDSYRRKFYVVSSLRELKDNIKTIENASERVDNLRGVSFTSKCEADDPNVVMYGFIAEEVEKACPELASYADGKLQGVQYDRVCALLLEDNKACHRRIEALEKRLEELERRLDK